jgi:hypothetical protein
VLRSAAAIRAAIADKSVTVRRTATIVNCPVL